MQKKIRRGFTLAEIMFVVVIIGLLLAIALPSFRKVRNNAIEKSLINDGRLLSTGIIGFLSENPVGTVSADQLIGGESGVIPSLSSGVILTGGATASAAAPGTQQPLTGIFFSSAQNVGTIAPENCFTLSHPLYSTDFSGNLKFSDTTYYPAGSHGLVFSVDSGKVLDQNLGQTANLD